jgi:hypothetical protein
VPWRKKIFAGPWSVNVNDLKNTIFDLKFSGNRPAKVDSPASTRAAFPSEVVVRIAPVGGANRSSRWCESLQSVVRIAPVGGANRSSRWCESLQSQPTEGFGSTALPIAFAVVLRLV